MLTGLTLAYKGDMSISLSIDLKQAKYCYTRPMLFLYLFYLLFGVLIIVIGAAFIIEGWKFQKPDRIFYVGSNIREQGPRVVQVIESYIGDTEKYTLVELGAGLAFMASFLAYRFKWKSVEAVELGSVILFFGRLRRFLLRKTKIHFVQAKCSVLLLNQRHYD